VLFGVGGRADCAVCLLAEATAATLVLAAAVVVVVVWRLAVNAGAACFSVCGEVRSWWYNRRQSPGWASWCLWGWAWFRRFAGCRSPRRSRVGRCGRTCGLVLLPTGKDYGGYCGVGGGGIGMGGLPVGGHRGCHVFVGVRRGAVWVVRPLPVVVFFALLLAAVAAVWAF